MFVGGLRGKMSMLLHKHKEDDLGGNTVTRFASRDEHFPLLPIVLKLKEYFPT